MLENNKAKQGEIDWAGQRNLKIKMEAGINSWIS